MRSALVFAALFAAACASEVAKPGRLTARPHDHPAAIAARGEMPLGVGDTQRDGRVYVPAQAREKYPLMLLLHGAHGAGERIERRLQDLADQFGFIIVAPDSRGMTWDVTRGALGPDVDFIDRALAAIFARYPVDASHLAVAGFSDGASYALTIGIINGDLFTHVIAFSPGFIATNYGFGRPPIFISHGTADEILPFNQTSKVYVPGLRHNGYRVRFRTFDGPHTIPHEVATEAMQWWLGDGTLAGGVQ
jgi:phospholipase/carboxylesterase